MAQGDGDGRVEDYYRTSPPERRYRNMSEVSWFVRHFSWLWGEILVGQQEFDTRKSERRRKK